MSDAARALPEAESALPPGTRLGEFEVRTLLGVGGFGIVYLAFDHALEREVAVKEYMPATMAGRTESLHVSLRSKSDAEVFGLGLKSFVNEAKLLAKFDHPSLIKVHRFWEANGTAYMAMPVLRGRTLKDIRRSTGRAPDEVWIRATLTPLLGALEQLHREGVYHRDISPDNIHLEADGHPVLLDFGAARRVISGKTQTLTAILKPAYAPIEQYAETGAVKQGPWTDLYALGATLHFMLLGYPPAPATARTVADEATELLGQAMAGVSPQMLGIIDWMLAPRPADRPQCVAELRAVLEGRVALPQRVGATAAPAVWDKAATAPITVPLGEGPWPDLELDDLGAVAPATMPGASSTSPAPGATATSTASTAPAGSAPLAAGEASRPPPARAFAPRAAVFNAGRGSTSQGPATALVEPLPVAADDAHRLPPPPSRSRAVPLALAGVLLAGVLGYFGWSGLLPGFAGAAAPALASSAAAAASASAGLDAATATAAAPAAAAGQQASAAAAAAQASGAVNAAANPLPPSAQASAALTASNVALPASAAAAEAASAAPSIATAASATAAPATTVAPVVPRPPPRTTTAAPPPRPAGAGSQAAPGPEATPEALCAGRNPLSHFVCMERECLRGRFTNHPECRAWRQQARPRDASGN
jgi:hypothetical protein